MSTKKAISVKVTHQVCRLALSGEITIAQSSNLREEALRALAKGLPIAVDLSAVTYLDAACLQVIHSLRNTAGASVSVAGTPAQLLDDARMLGMQEVVTG